VKYDGTAFTAWYYDFNGLYLPESMRSTEESDIDFFMEFTQNPTFEMLKSSVSQVNYIRPELIVMNKIICGDSSDNIKSIVLQEKNNKQYRITEKVWNKYREDNSIESLEDFFSKEDIIIEDLLKLKNSKETPEEIYPKFDYNTKLVWLDESIYPPEVLMQFEDSEYKQFDIEYVLNNYKTMDTTYQNDEVVGNFLNMGISSKSV
jgi:hypothetical protein